MAKAYVDDNIEELKFINVTKTTSDNLFDICWDQIIVRENNIFTSLEIPLSSIASYDELNSIIGTTRFTINDDNTLSRLVLTIYKPKNSYYCTIQTKSFEKLTSEMVKMPFSELGQSNAYSFYSKSNGEVFIANDNFEVKKPLFDRKKAKELFAFPKNNALDVQGTKCSPSIYWAEYTGSDMIYYCTCHYVGTTPQEAIFFFDEYFLPALQYILDLGYDHYHAKIAPIEQNSADDDQLCRNYFYNKLYDATKNTNYLFACENRSILKRFGGPLYTYRTKLFVGGGVSAAIDMLFCSDIHGSWNEFFEYLVENPDHLGSIFVNYLENEWDPHDINPNKSPKECSHEKCFGCGKPIKRDDCTSLCKETDFCPRNGECKARITIDGPDRVGLCEQFDINIKIESDNLTVSYVTYQLLCPNGVTVNYTDVDYNHNLVNAKINSPGMYRFKAICAMMNPSDYYESNEIVVTCSYPTMDDAMKNPVVKSAMEKSWQNTLDAADSFGICEFGGIIYAVTSSSGVLQYEYQEIKGDAVSYDDYYNGDVPKIEFNILEKDKGPQNGGTFCIMLFHTHPPLSKYVGALRMSRKTGFSEQDYAITEYPCVVQDYEASVHDSKSSITSKTKYYNNGVIK